MVRSIWVLGLVLFLAACGGGGGARPTDRNSPPRVLPFPPDQFTPGSRCLAGCFQYRKIPQLDASDARRMPVYEHPNETRVDVGIAQSQLEGQQLPVVGKRGEFDIRHGRLNDGPSRVALSNFLDDALAQPRAPRQESAPVVRFGGRAASRENISRLIHAVQVVNAALPEGRKIRIPSDAPVHVNPRDVTYVEFIPRAEWPYDRDILGKANTYLGRGDHHIEVQGDMDATYTVSVLVHELVHTLGLGHVAIGPDSILEERLNEHAFNILHAIDRDALRVFYGRMETDEWPADFGPWSSTSTHLHGNGRYAGFGVTLRNGYVEPWAYGPKPFRGNTVANWPIADNPNLAGSATWTGHLLGFSAEAPVAGDATIGVDLGTLTGSAAFTALEQWAAGTAPGVAGSGQQWGDGDLRYSIGVRGNRFRETGGDEGILTGIFTGENHMGAAGTLERQDLTAAFGASRQ